MTSTPHARTAQTRSATMRAIAQDVYGPADVLQLRTLPRPEIAADEVLVRVHAAGVDRGVWHLMTGLPYPIRLAGYGLRAPKNPVPGSDLAGVVEAVGADVTRFIPGDEVFGIGIGSYAEYARAREDKLAPKPVGLTFAQAAVVPISGSTALQALRDHGRVQQGDRVLIIGASGGVGTYAVQIARALGAHVTGVCSTAKVDLVASLGVDAVIDYTREDPTETAQPYDLIVDIGGNTSLTRLRRALTPRGRAVLAGGETGGRWLGGYDRVLRAPLVSMVVGQTLGGFVNDENHHDLLVLSDLVASGQVTPVIDRTFQLADAPAAIAHVAGGHARGKSVITV